MRILLSVLIMAVGYSIAIYTIARVFITAFSFRSRVPFVPSSRASVIEIAKLLSIKAGDSVIDIGSGSGTLVCALARAFPKAGFTGIEINRMLILIATIRKSILRLGNVEFVAENAFNYDFSRFNKVCMYMTSDFNDKIMTFLEKQLPIDAIVVSSVFDFGKNFMEIHESEISVYNIVSSKNSKKLYLWIKKQ